MCAGGSDRYAVAHWLASGVVWVALVTVAPRCRGADTWGGSLALTSDYIVRGISRSNDQAALQLDLHYFNTSGFVAGAFASNTQLDPGEPRDVELNAFLGFVWTGSGDWSGKILASHYSYPWHKAGSRYDYDELDLDAVYREWLDVRVVYSPDAPRFSSNGRLVNGTTESTELNLQKSLLGKLSGTAGIGYSYLGAANAAGYAYWSVGAAYDLAPVFLAMSFVDTTAAANTLFYNAAAGGRWTGTVIWRF